MRTLLGILLLASSLFAQEIRRPDYDQADLDATGTAQCVAPTDSSLGMPDAYDAGGTSTSSSNTLSAEGGNLFAAAREFRGIAAASGSYSALSLNVNSSCIHSDEWNGACALEYSLDYGSTWATLKASGTWAQQTYTATLPAEQDLTQIKVRACWYANSDVLTSNSTITFAGFDMWTSGTLAASKRRVVVIR